MPIDKTIWTELWRRAEREEIGLYLRFTDTHLANVRLNQSRPPHMRGYTIARTPEPDLLFIVRPEIDIHRRRNAVDLALARGEPSPRFASDDDFAEPLP